MAGWRRGRVVVFDEHRGIGEVVADDGARYPFHCTAVADGSRTVPEAAAVEFRVVNGPIGTYEATELRVV